MESFSFEIRNKNDYERIMTLLEKHGARWAYGQKPREYNPDKYIDFRISMRYPEIRITTEDNPCFNVLKFSEIKEFLEKYKKQKPLSYLDSDIKN